MSDKRVRKYRGAVIGRSGVSEDMERRAIDSIIAERERKAAKVTEDARRAAEIGVSVDAYLQAQADLAEARSRDRHAMELETARAALADGPPDADWLSVRKAYASWFDDHGLHAGEPPKAEMLTRSGLGRDRFDATLRRHGVNDARRLGATLRAMPGRSIA